MNEIRPLTGLRGVAAISVFLAHLRLTLTDYGLDLSAPEWVVRLFLNGGRQVDIFFVLSGFILTMNYRAWFAESVPLRSYLTFLRRRFARIYPLHFVMLLLVVAFVLAARVGGAATTHGLDRFEAATLPAHLLLMQAWGIFFPGPGEWNPPSWSVSIEALAYLFFPLVVWVSVRAFDRRPWVPVLLAIAIGFGLNALTPWGLSGFAGVARGLSEFTLGCLVMNLSGSRMAAWLQRDSGSLVALAIIVLCYLLTPDTGFVIAACSIPLLLALSRPNLAGRFFGCRPIFFLGEISYSIYLGHFLFSAIAYRIVSPAWMKTGNGPALVGIALIIGFVLCLSTVCYYAVERPGRRLLSGRRPNPST